MGKFLAVIGVALSLIYFGLVFWLFSGRFSDLTGMPLNAVGDFLAGVFGPVAVLWLILGFFQQGIELRQQAIELKTTVEQQGELVGISKDQLSIAKSNAELEHERLQFSIEPKFCISLKKLEKFENAIRYVLLLTNGGHTVTCLRVRLTQGVPYMAAPVLQAGQSIDIECFQDRIDMSANEDIRIEYLNGVETRKYKSFSVGLSRDSNGEFSFYTNLPEGDTAPSVL